MEHGALLRDIAIARFSRHARIIAETELCVPSTAVRDVRPAFLRHSDYSPSCDGCVEIPVPVVGDSRPTPSDSLCQTSTVPRLDPCHTEA